MRARTRRLKLDSLVMVGCLRCPHAPSIPGDAGPRGQADSVPSSEVDPLCLAVHPAGRDDRGWAWSPPGISMARGRQGRQELRRTAGGGGDRPLALGTRRETNPHPAASPLWMNQSITCGGAGDTAAAGVLGRALAGEAAAFEQLLVPLIPP